MLCALKIAPCPETGCPVFCEATAVTEFYNANTGKLIPVCLAHAERLSRPEYVAAGWGEA